MRGLACASCCSMLRRRLLLDSCSGVTYRHFVYGIGPRARSAYTASAWPGGATEERYVAGTPRRPGSALGDPLQRACT